MKRKIKCILVIAIVNVLLLSGMSIGASNIENDEELISKQPYEQKELTFMNWFLNFLDRILEPFPRLRNALSFTNVNAGVNGCLVDLPTDPVTMYAWERPGSWPAFFKIELSGVGGGFDVSDGEYNGWCIDYGTPIPNGVALSVMLYSSYCPPGHLDYDPEWNQINYILNNKQGDRWDIQRAIWYFINEGPTPWNQPHPESPVVTSDAWDMINGAIANPGYIPGPGEIVAVICDPIPYHDFQYTFIEVPVPEQYEGLTPGFWKNHPEDWVGYTTVQRLVDVGFVIPNDDGIMDDNPKRPVDETDLLFTALRYKGGWGLSGAAQILLRAAVAAILNAAHPGINYPIADPNDIIDDVNDALDGTRSQMISLANELDEYNNLGGEL
jgi:hypothetical protein